MHTDLKKFISDILIDTVQRTVQRMDSEDTHRPFHAALLSENLLIVALKGHSVRLLDKVLLKKFLQKCLNTMVQVMLEINLLVM